MLYYLIVIVMVLLGLGLSDVSPGLAVPCVPRLGCFTILIAIVTIITIIREGLTARRLPQPGSLRGGTAVAVRFTSDIQLKEVNYAIRRNRKSGP